LQVMNRHEQGHTALNASMTFHHLGYLVRDTARSANALRDFFPAVTLLRKPHELQGAHITYMATADGNTRLELVEPFENNKLLAGKLDRQKRECLPYHICLQVDDFDTEYNRLRQHGWLALSRPFESFTFDTQAAHLYKPAAGIVEIMGRSTRLRMDRPGIKE
jgi:methylmalonyl-CoA/ethylmalonyl-CoA epimerase